MRRAEEDLRRGGLLFSVLNCGKDLVGFYTRLGFERVSDCGLYLRNGEARIDEDPALAMGLREGFHVSALACEAFPFGFDF